MLRCWLSKGSVPEASPVPSGGSGGVATLRRGLVPSASSKPCNDSTQPCTGAGGLVAPVLFCGLVLELCGVGGRCGTCACFGCVASPPLTSLRDLTGSQEVVKGVAAAGRLCNSLAEGFPMSGLTARTRSWRYLMIFREPGVPVWRWGAAVVLAVLVPISGISIPFSSV